MKALLNRLVHEDKQTLGIFSIFEDVTNVFECKALELPDRHNESSISRIPEGEYTCKRRWSKKYGWHYHVLNVPGRSYILLHFGNYYTDIRGCILLGNGFVDINKDGYRDVTSSKKTMRRLLKIAPKTFVLKVLDL